MDRRPCVTPWKRGLPLAAWVAALLFPAVAAAAQVRGVVDAPPSASVRGTLGYTRTRIAAPSQSSQSRRADVALYLMVKESLPIAPPDGPFPVAISGLRLQPSVAACVIDGKVSFTNHENVTMTVLIERKPFAELAPGQSKTYECNAVERDARTVQIKEWPHIRGVVFVGELGVVGQPNSNGAFSLIAPQGKYQLKVIGENGVLSERAIEVKADVDLGRIDLSKGGGA